jgi:hypothetical protein
MRHAKADDLVRLSSLLVELRALDGLKEKTPGSFYRGSKGFLHFHIDSDDVYADVKLDGATFERRRVTTNTERRALVSAVRRALK